MAWMTADGYAPSLHPAAGDRCQNGICVFPAGNHSINFFCFGKSARPHGMTRYATPTCICTGILFLESSKCVVRSGLVEFLFASTLH
jgi:hypothetical protein